MTAILSNKRRKLVITPDYSKFVASGKLKGAFQKSSRGRAMKPKFVFALMFLLAYGAGAQNNTDWVKTSTPKVLSISIEKIRVGQEAAHEKIESGWRRAFNKANYPSYFLGLSSLTGSSTMLFLTGFDSLQAWQKEDEDQSANAWLWTEQDKLHIEDSAFVSTSAHEFGELLPESSVSAKFPLGAARCFSVTWIEVDPSRQREFREWLRGQVDMKSSTIPHLATYRIIAGGSISTFVLFEARLSKSAFDKDRLDFENVVAGVRSVSRDFFEPNPRNSRVTAEFAKGNEEFWLTPER